SRPAEPPSGSATPTRFAPPRVLARRARSPRLPTLGWRDGLMTAVHPESAADAGAVGSFVRQRGQRKIRPSGSSTSCETRPQDRFGHRILAVIGTTPLPPPRRQ